MKIWNLFCEIALFNKIWNWLSGKSDNPASPSSNPYHPSFRHNDFIPMDDDFNDDMDIYDDLDDF